MADQADGPDFEHDAVLRFIITRRIEEGASPEVAREFAREVWETRRAADLANANGNQPDNAANAPPGGVPPPGNDGPQANPNGVGPDGNNQPQDVGGGVPGNPDPQNPHGGDPAPPPVPFMPALPPQRSPSPEQDAPGAKAVVPLFRYTETTRIMPSDIPFEPSAAAMTALRKGLFVPLHHFHPTMCRAAFDKQSIKMNDTIALQVDGNAVSLVREGGLPQKGIRKDNELTFEEFELASAALVEKMRECTHTYSEEVLKDIYVFFHELSTHKSRSLFQGPESITACITQCSAREV
ncbi:hypothetical protein BC629DRAFT_1505580, partial [Irpex lacteus]